MTMPQDEFAQYKRKQGPPDEFAQYKRARAPSGASSSWTPQTTSSKIWNFATTPLLPAGRAETEGRAFAASGPTTHEAVFTQKHPTLGPLVAGGKRGLAGAYSDTLRTARESTTPLALATLGVTKGVGKAAEILLPNAARAERTAQAVMQAVRTHPVDVQGPGKIALEIDRLARSGGTRPKIISDFLRRVTAPQQGPLTYEEARRFYENSTRLSIDETRRLTPNMRRMVGQFTQELNKAISSTAASGNKLAEYQSFMKEYYQAMKLRRQMDALKKYAIKAIPYVAGAYATDRILKDRWPHGR